MLLWHAMTYAYTISANQKSVHRPFLSQSPKRVGSANLPPRRGPPHSISDVPRQASGSTNISSISSSSSSSLSRRFGSVDMPCEHVDSSVDIEGRLASAPPALPIGVLPPLPFPPPVLVTSMPLPTPLPSVAKDRSWLRMVALVTNIPLLTEVPEVHVSHIDAESAAAAREPESPLRLLAVVTPTHGNRRTNDATTLFVAIMVVLCSFS